jgi:hypothetical protein
MDQIIRTLSDFVKIIENLQRKPGSSFYYRGHDDSMYELEPSLFRKMKSIENEHLMFKEFIKENPNDFRDDNTALEKLVKMQHYGIPTRLLDITRNPLVALYFACIASDGKTKNKINGEVVILSIPGKLIRYYDSDSVSILSNLSKLKPKEKTFDFSLNRNDFNEQDSVYKLVWCIKEEKPNFSNIINPRDLKSIFCVKVKKNNDRIKIQDGLFLIFGMDNDNGKLMVDKDWIVSNKTNHKIIIDGHSKQKIKKQLEEVNITKNTLFPELENSASLIKNLYS